MIAAADVGKWNEDLFLAFRRAKGEKRRQLLDELLVTNRPLVKILVGQLAGITDEKTTSRRRRPTRMRVIGADALPWDDLMQAGLAGMAHALGKFDPAKGKISGYARWWILTNLQRLVRKEAMVKVRDGETPVGVSLIDDEAELDRLAGVDEDDQPGIERILTIEQVHQWEKMGSWPKEYEWARENYVKECPDKARRVHSIARRPLDVFLEVRCLFGKGGLYRAPVWPLWNAWRLECLMARRPEGSRKRFLSSLGKRDAVEKCVRFEGIPQRGLAGVRLVATS